MLLLSSLHRTAISAIVCSVSMIAVVGCYTRSAPRTRVISASSALQRVKGPTNQRAVLALEPPRNEAWLVVKNQLQAAMVLFDKNGGSFGVLNANEAYVIRGTGERQRLYAAPSPYGCLTAGCPQVLDIAMIPGCVYFASIDSAFPTTPTSALRKNYFVFTQSDLSPNDTVPNLDLSRTGRPRDAGPIASPVGERTVAAGRHLPTNEVEWSDSLAICPAEPAPPEAEREIAPVPPAPAPERTEDGRVPLNEPGY